MSIAAKQPTPCTECKGQGSWGEEYMHAGVDHVCERCKGTGIEPSTRHRTCTHD